MNKKRFNFGLVFYFCFSTVLLDFKATAALFHKTRSGNKHM